MFDSRHPIYFFSVWVIFSTFLMGQPGQPPYVCEKFPMDIYQVLMDLVHAHASSNTLDGIAQCLVKILEGTDHRTMPWE